LFASFALFEVILSSAGADFSAWSFKRTEVPKDLPPCSNSSCFKNFYGVRHTRFCCRS